MTLDELHAALDANWESVGFLTREHEEARRAAAHEALDALLGRAAARPGPARRRSSATSRSASGGTGSAAATTGSTATTPGGSSSPTTSRATCATWRTANRRARESLQLSIYALAHEAEHGALPGRAGAALPRVRHRRPRGADREAAREGAGAAGHGGRGDPRRPLRGDPVARCAAATARSARSAPTQRGERPPSARRRRPHPAGDPGRGAARRRRRPRLSGRDARSSPAPTRRATGRVVVALASVSAALLVTPFAFLGEVMARQAHRLSWRVAAGGAPRRSSPGS